jgi:hypothetical protein
MNTPTKKSFILVLTLVLGIICFINSSLALNVSSNSSIAITVNVSQKTIVTVYPATLSWTGTDSVEPGEQGVTKYILIENMGSTNISYIWFNNSYPKNDPFGSAVAANYDAGNFVLIARNGSNNFYRHPNRVDYNSSYDIIYLTPPAAGYSSYGKFRDGKEEFFWYMRDVDDDGYCNSSAGTDMFYIGKDPHNETEQGTTDFTNCDATLINPAGAQSCRSGTLTDDPNSDWGFANVFAGSNADYDDYVVATHWSCNHTMFYYWNMDAPGAAATDDNDLAANYFANATSPLVPGMGTVANVIVRVPYGVYFGQSGAGTLTVIAMAVNVEA